ncbi:MAG: ABC transporter ATP-binding protein [Bacilli bacterium]
MDKKVIVKLEDFEKNYGEKTVIKNLNLEVYEGEFLTLLGSSGCGKTTILRCISGLELPTKGKIYLDNEDVTFKDPQKRHVNTIFQNYALFPFMSVKDNVAFGLKMKKVDEKEIEKRVSNMIKLVHLEGYENRKPKELSGGEQQRVSIIRGLINNPRVLLLDEPLSALDLKLRKKMQIELKHLQKKLGITFIYVTHDQDEALSMSDRIVVLNKGKIEQIGTPLEVYENPKSEYVANFLGEANIFKGKVIKNEDNKSIIETDNKEFITVVGDYPIDSKLSVVVRPENIKLSKTERKMNCIKGVIKDEIYDGSVTKLIIKTENETIKQLTIGNDRPFRENDEVFMYWTLDDCVIMGSAKDEKK